MEAIGKWFVEETWLHMIQADCTTRGAEREMSYAMFVSSHKRLACPYWSASRKDLHTTTRSWTGRILL